MGKSVMKSRMIKSRGFSLLEIIIALAIVGIVLVSLATYARKVIDEHVRQVDAEAVAQEVYGVLQFVNADTIEIFGSTNPADTSKRVIRRVTNPLYQLPGMFVYPDDQGTAAAKGMSSNPIYMIHPHTALYVTDVSVNPSPYIGRSLSKSITSSINNKRKITDDKDRYNDSLKWSEALWGADSVRRYFTDSGCPGTTGNPVYFKQQYLSCSENPTLKNSEIAVSRVDLVNDKGGLNRLEGSDPSKDYASPVSRVDVYVSFRPVDGNSARLEQFITPLMTAFRARKIVPNANNVYLVMQDGADSSDNAWTLLDKNNGNAATVTTPDDHLAVFTDLPDMIGKLRTDRIYALRFTFDGSGDYLRNDGLNAATKLCWNTAAGAAGPCLISHSQDSLVLKRRDNPREFANLQVGSVILKGSYMDSHGNTQPEYYTAPQIQYAAFSNINQIPPYYRNPADGATDLCTSAGCGHLGPDPDEIADILNGAIAVPVQTCPQNVVDDNGTHVDMYPRLNTAVSSVVSGMRREGNTKVFPNNGGPYFNRPSENLVELNHSNVSINRLGGAVLQARQSADRATWRIAAMVGSEDTRMGGHPWQYYNPPWLSVMITTWCSSIDQP